MSRKGTKDKEDSNGWVVVDHQGDCQGTMSCSESGSDEMPVGAQGDLASRTLVLESKRFYLDVKENQRGRFIKVAEISADGRKVGKLCNFNTNYLLFHAVESNSDDLLNCCSVQPESCQVH